MRKFLVWELFMGCASDYLIMLKFNKHSKFHGGKENIYGFFLFPAYQSTIHSINPSFKLSINQSNYHLFYHLNTELFSLLLCVNQFIHFCLYVYIFIYLSIYLSLTLPFKRSINQCVYL